MSDTDDVYNTPFNSLCETDFSYWNPNAHNKPLLCFFEEGAPPSSINTLIGIYLYLFNSH